MLRFLALGPMLLLLTAPIAQSLTISSVAISTNAGDSGFLNAGSSEHDSAVSVLSAGGTTADGVGASVSAGTRYAQYIWADNTFGSTTQDSTADYSVIMDITPDDSGTVYDVQIDTTRLGALTLIDDSTFSGCCFSTADIGSVAGTIGGVTDGGLAMGGLSNLQGNVSTNVDINQTGTGISLVGLTGNYSLVLNFVWTASAFSNNDEGAVRLGLESTVGGVSAGDYPGPGGRTIGNDGHFVDVTATVTSVIPEPGTALLLGLGLLGLSTRKPRG